MNKEITNKIYSQFLMILVSMAVILNISNYYYNQEKIVAALLAGMIGSWFFGLYWKKLSMLLVYFLNNLGE